MPKERVFRTAILIHHDLLGSGLHGAVIKLSQCLNADVLNVGDSFIARFTGSLNLTQ